MCNNNHCGGCCPSNCDCNQFCCSENNNCGGCNNSGNHCGSHFGGNYGILIILIVIILFGCGSWF